MRFEGGVALTAAVAGLVALIIVPTLFVADDSGQIGQPGQMGAIDLDRTDADVNVTGSSPVRAGTGREEAKVKTARDLTDPGNTSDASKRDGRPRQASKASPAGDSLVGAGPATSDRAGPSAPVGAPSGSGDIPAESDQPPVVGEPPPGDQQLSPVPQQAAAESPPPADAEVYAAVDDDDVEPALEPSEGDPDEADGDPDEE